MSGRQADHLILTASPEAVALCESAFDRAYQGWWRSLSDRAVDFVPVAEATGENLFQAFLSELKNDKRPSGHY